MKMGWNFNFLCGKGGFLRERFLLNIPKMHWMGCISKPICFMFTQNFNNWDNTWAWPMYNSIWTGLWGNCLRRQLFGRQSSLIGTFLIHKFKCICWQWAACATGCRRTGLIKVVRLPAFIPPNHMGIVPNYQTKISIFDERCTRLFS